MANNRSRDNNPRVFAETIALDAWRTPFDGERADADLHIDVVFGTKGRVGGGDDPVRFRLSLNRAEIHVIRDAGGILDIKRSSVLRPQVTGVKSTMIEEQKKSGNAGIALRASHEAASFSANAGANVSVDITERLESTEDVPRLRVRHWPTEAGFAFRIEPNFGDRLDGQPWAADTPVMKLCDQQAGRPRGEPPEVTIKINCKREDMIIEDIEFTSGSVFSWENIGRNKQLVVEQYIKDELVRLGMECGDLSEKFTTLILADAIPVEEK